MEVPSSGTPGLANKSARKHARRALRAGVTWTRITEESEKLCTSSTSPTRTCIGRRGDAAYQVADYNFHSLLKCEQWLAAWLDGEPILLSVTAVDRDWAMMCYFNSFGSDRTAGSTRYLMTQVLTDVLAELGVRFVCDSEGSSVPAPEGASRVLPHGGFQEPPCARV